MLREIKLGVLELTGQPFHEEEGLELGSVLQSPDGLVLEDNGIYDGLETWPLEHTNDPPK